MQLSPNRFGSPRCRCKVTLYYYYLSWCYKQWSSLPLLTPVVLIWRQMNLRLKISVICTGFYPVQPRWEYKTIKCYFILYLFIFDLYFLSLRLWFLPFFINIVCDIFIFCFSLFFFCYYFNITLAQSLYNRKISIFTMFMIKYLTSEKNTVCTVRITSIRVGQLERKPHDSCDPRERR